MDGNNGSPNTETEQHVADVLGLNMSPGAFSGLVLTMLLIIFLCFCKGYFFFQNRCTRERPGVIQLIGGTNREHLHHGHQLPGKPGADPPCYDNVMLQMEKDSVFFEVSTDGDLAHHVKKMSNEDGTPPPPYDVATEKKE